MSVYRDELYFVLRIGECIAFCCIFNRVDCEIFRRNMVLLTYGDINVQVSRLLSVRAYGWNYVLWLRYNRAVSRRSMLYGGEW
jgi:hypothetical protein